MVPHGRETRVPVGHIRGCLERGTSRSRSYPKRSRCRASSTVWSSSGAASIWSLVRSTYTFFSAVSTRSTTPARHLRLELGPGRQLRHPVVPGPRRAHRMLSMALGLAAGMSANTFASIISTLRVLRRQPVIGRRQVDAGRLDGGVPGLGLHRLQPHPSLPQPSQARVPQLVTRRMRQPGTATRTVEDLVEPVDRQRLAAVTDLSRHSAKINRLRSARFLMLDVVGRRKGRFGFGRLA
jgi:hypothetical protein